MVTLLDVFAILLSLTGFLFGGLWGARFGAAGAIGGTLAGGALGLFLGRLPTRMVISRARRELAPLSSVELRARLRQADCWTPNVLLLELRSRGEDIRFALPLVLGLMEAECPCHRVKGFAALLSAFPEVAKFAKGYNPNHSLERCKQKVAELKDRRGPERQT
jgi:hypothetical protein